MAGLDFGVRCFLTSKSNGRCSELLEQLRNRSIRISIFQEEALMRRAARYRIGFTFCAISSIAYWLQSSVPAAPAFGADAVDKSLRTEITVEPNEEATVTITTADSVETA